MLLFGTNIEMLPGWQTEGMVEGHGRVHYQAPEGTIDLACYELLPGILLTDIDLACSTLPASVPLSPRLSTVNWCAMGRCEVDCGEQGSLVVATGELCLSSAHAQTFSYPTGTYCGFEILVDPSHIGADEWHMLKQFGLTESRLAEGLCPPHLGTIVTPAGQLAQVVDALVGELATERPRNAWLLIYVCELLMLLVEADFSNSMKPGSYLRRSQRDMAQAVYRHIVSHMAPDTGLGALSVRFGVSEASLRSYFSRVYGQSPAAFAREHALAAAAQLLAQTNRSIADVSQACGYANPSKFAAAFRRAYDVSPLEYRRRSRLS